jgi:hypothetical protein
VLERAAVPLGEVDDVDGVAHAGAVDGVVVATEDLEALAAPGCDLHEVGHEVVRIAPRVLADRGEAAASRA